MSLEAGTEADHRCLGNVSEREKSREEVGEPHINTKHQVRRPSPAETDSPQGLRAGMKSGHVT